MSKRLPGGWLVAVALVVGMVLAPVGAWAAGQLVEVSGPNGVVARVTSAMQLQTAEATPNTFVYGRGFAASNGVCSPVLAIPSTRAMIVKTVVIDTFELPASGPGNLIDIYAGPDCHPQGLRLRHNPGRIGAETFQLEPGIAVPAGHTLWTMRIGAPSAEVFAHGYSVPKGAVPGAASGPAQSNDVADPQLD